MSNYSLLTCILFPATYSHEQSTAPPPPKSRAPALPWHSSSQTASSPSGGWTQCLSGAFLQDSAVSTTQLGFEHLITSMAHFPPSFFSCGNAPSISCLPSANSIIFQVKKLILCLNTTVVCIIFLVLAKGVNS
jgi:hypothetical protein